MSKERIKLTTQQKEWLSNLTWFVTTYAPWKSIPFTCPRDLKEIVSEGRYVVFSYMGELSAFSGYRWALGCETMEQVEDVMRWNGAVKYMALDLETLMIVREVTKYYRPTFDLWKMKKTSEVK